MARTYGKRGPVGRRVVDTPLLVGQCLKKNIGRVNDMGRLGRNPHVIAPNVPFSPQVEPGCAPG